MEYIMRISLTPIALITCEQGTGNSTQGTGNRVQGKGNREQETVNSEKGTGNREQVTNRSKHFSQTFMFQSQIQRNTFN